jgi:solute carrier family 25 phosphate transporter 3
MDHSLIPSFLYSSTSSPQKKIVDDVSTIHHTAVESSKFMIPSPSESGRRNIKLFSRDYYLACAVGGSICCGFTHMAVTPLDLVKCNMQVGLFLYISFPLY